MSLEIDYSLEFGGQKLGFSVGKIARQAGGSVFVTYGGTALLCTVVVGQVSDEERDFLPLTVDYAEKFYAVGKIPGGFLKREGRPSEQEILMSRVIDRSLRPLVQDGFARDVHVTCTLMSYDPECDHGCAGLIGVSLACRLAGLPLKGTIAGCRVGYIDDKLVISPAKDTPGNKLDLFLSATKSSIFMVESEAKELSEDQMLQALELGQNALLPVIDLIDEIADKHGKPVIEFVKSDHSSLYKAIAAKHKSTFESAYKIVDKQNRSNEISAIKKLITDEFAGDAYSKVAVGSVCDSLQKDIVRNHVISTGSRIDGRKSDEIRHLDTKLNILPSDLVHGSALFTRGETQALVVTTLGGGSDEQMINSVIDISKKEHFMLHYNFPQYCVGGVGSSRGVGRREVGHGNLAARALRAVLPSKDSFPYTIRVVSEITESNGSSSMATVCGGTLSLLATGVPLKSPVAGIAMGLIKEPDSCIVLTDIMGDEDHLGDMDFKVAKTVNGITALQMDIKIAGISLDIMSTALQQAASACTTILKKIDETISSPASLGNNIPKVEELTVPVKKIAEVIGKSGATIKAICEETEAKIDIEPDGTVKIFAPDSEKLEAAKAMIIDIISDIEVGSICNGVVEKIMPFGLIVALPGKKSGMVHISEIADEHIDNIHDYVNEGERVKVKVLGFDDRRRIKLSIRRAGSDGDDGNSNSNSSSGRPPVSFSDFTKDINNSNV